MNFRIFTAVGMFVASCIIGFGLRQTVTVVQAAPVIPSPIEFPRVPIATEVKESVKEIDVEIDLSTSEVSVKGTTDAIVNVTTIGKPKPIVKWKTKIVEKPISTGYPKVRSISKVSDKEQPVSPLSQISEE